MREKVFSGFSSRYSLVNLRYTAYICTTVTNWASYPRSSSHTSTARNWSVSGKAPRKSLQNTPLSTTTSSHLYRPSWTTARACPGRWKPLPHSGLKSLSRCAEKMLLRNWLTAVQCLPVRLPNFVKRIKLRKEPSSASKEHANPTA